MPSTLCTLLPDLPPLTPGGRVFFRSTLRSDWCHDYDAPDMHDDFQSEGHPYTVQVSPPLPEEEPELSPDDFF
jgi:hypothetical protein